MKRKLDAVIFDFDGVLFDTEEINYSANEATFYKYGMSFSREQYSKLWIDEGLDMEDIVLRYDLDVTAKQLREIKNKIFLDIIRQTPFSFMLGIRESIEELLLNGYKIAIASSNFRENIEIILGNSNTNFDFNPIIGREDIENPKPHPEVFLKCLKSMELPPKRSIVIEDAPKGIIGAKRSGIQKVIAIPNSWTYNGDFSEATFVLESAKELSARIIELG